MSRPQPLAVLGEAIVIAKRQRMLAWWDHRQLHGGDSPMCGHAFRYLPGRGKTFGNGASASSSAASCNRAGSSFNPKQQLHISEETAVIGDVVKSFILCRFDSCRSSRADGCQEATGSGCASGRRGQGRLQFQHASVWVVHRDSFDAWGGVRLCFLLVPWGAHVLPARLWSFLPHIYIYIYI